LKTKVIQEVNGIVPVPGVGTDVRPDASTKDVMGARPVPGGGTDVRPDRQVENSLSWATLAAAS